MITCECGEKMKRYEQPTRFGHSFTFWKCEKCGKFLREEISESANGLDKQANPDSKPSD
jgi:hypothetical protein